MRKAFVVVFLAGAAVACLQAAPPAESIFWKKTVVDRAFNSEGVGIADVNRDGKIDIITGDYWYEAPKYTKHAIRKQARDYGDGQRGYSESFAVWCEDFNKDNYPDAIVVPFPGAPIYWYENPQGQTGPWKAHLLWHSACNETPLFVDLFGTGQRVLLMGFQPKGQKPDGNEGQMAWFRPGADPTQPWEMHPISLPSEPGKPVPGTMRFSHGLGAADLNGDGRLDVICTGGWWEQPEKDTGTAWKFHPANLGEACADMHTLDMDGDGKLDVLSTSAHKFGIWWHQQRASSGGSPSFIKKDLFRELLSETHAAHFVDINGDGLKDLVTGKRWWSHGRSEPGSDWPAMLYWFEQKKDPKGLVSFRPHIIDTDSGVGTQFVVDDINGDKLLDVVVSNKKGVHILEQVRKP